MGNNSKKRRAAEEHNRRYEAVGQERRAKVPTVRTVDVFINEFGNMKINKLAQTGDTEKYLITSEAAPDISKEFWISSAQVSANPEHMAAEMANQIDRSADEMLKDMLMIQHGADWREHYEAMMAKYRGEE